MNAQMLFSIISAAVTLGGICIAFGVVKGKVERVAKDSEVQASKDELTAAMRLSEEKFNVLSQRAEEDRRRGDGRYKELYGIIGIHSERISALETSHNAVMKTLDELKLTVNNGFRELREDLKELRKHD
jgi:hypothetical protein